jgi:hypothetical protein
MFMAEMVTGTLEEEQQRLQGCKPGLELSQSVQARVGSAFGKALGAAYNNYGEETCSQAAQALFSATRRGLSPETGAATVEAFAENGYRMEEMYQFGMWMAERVSTGVPVDEEMLCEQVRTMTRSRVQLASMTRQMGQIMDGTDATDEGGSQSASSAGQAGGSGTGGNSSSGGNSSGGGNGNNSGSGGSDGGSGDGNGGNGQGN